MKFSDDVESDMVCWHVTFGKKPCFTFRNPG